MQNGIGEGVRRIEDYRLLTGQGRFSDDRNIDGQRYAAFVRSPHAHAEILSIDLQPALSAPGVREALTGADYLDDGLNPMPAGGNPKDVELKNRDGSPIQNTPALPDRDGQGPAYR